MQLGVFGATGGTGRALVATALDHGWTVRAFVRTQAGASLPLPSGLAVVHGDPDRAEDVLRAVRGSDAICCAFGPRPGDPRPFCASLTRRIVEAMREAGIRRIVCVTGAMVGDLPPTLSPALRALATVVRRRHPEIMADRALQEVLVLRSALDWTLVKPPRLTDAARTGTVHADAALPIGLLSRIGRHDLAEFVFRAATQHRFVNQRVYVRN
jgi:putative NADH-flavin reductase